MTCEEDEDPAIWQLPVDPAHLPIRLSHIVLGSSLQGDMLFTSHREQYLKNKKDKILILLLLGEDMVPGNPKNIF